MHGAAARARWNSAVYTYHIHLISPNEISSDLLFTRHPWAAAARGTATTQANGHARPGGAAISIRDPASAGVGEGGVSLFSWCRGRSTLGSQAERPAGVVLTEEGGKYSFHSLRGFAPLRRSVGARRR